MIEAEKVENVKNEEMSKSTKLLKVINVNNRDFISYGFEDPDLSFNKSVDIAGAATVSSSKKQSRMMRMLRVESDGTEELYNKYRETSKDREKKIELFEEQLNIKVNFMLLWLPQ